MLTVPGDGYGYGDPVPGDQVLYPGTRVFGYCPPPVPGYLCRRGMPAGHTHQDELRWTHLWVVCWWAAAALPCGLKKVRVTLKKNELLRKYTPHSALRKPSVKKTSPRERLRKPVSQMKCR